MASWEVQVGNIGRVFDGENGFDAWKTYREYVGQSKSGYGRAAGEDVTIMRDGEPVKEYNGIAGRCIDDEALQEMEG